MIEEIKKEFEKKKIGAIESTIQSLKDTADNSIERMTRVLFYLERTKRYRENPKYKKVSFERYIQDRFGIPYGRYQSHKTALARYPVESEKYGVDVVVKAKNACGTERAEKVFNDLGKSKKPLNLNQIDSTIRKYAKPKPKTEPIKSELEQLREENNRLKRELKSANDEIQEKDNRINKLISTIERMKSELFELEAA